MAMRPSPLKSLFPLLVFFLATADTGAQYGMTPCDIFKFYDSAKSFIEHGSYKPSLYGTMFLLLQAIILSRAMSEELYEMDSLRIFYMMPQIFYF
mgnify:CR=1 FL=1